MTKALAILLAVLVALSLFLGQRLAEQHREVGRLGAENTVLSKALSRTVEREKRDRRVLVAREAKIASEARKLAQAQEALSQVLQRNNAWSDTNVPTEVQQALQGRSGGPNSGPASMLHD